jgi:hypothetical protein
MRLSEKTLEINLCAQLSQVLGGVIWFGLTQRQEAQAGFDVCTRLGGRLLILQFKASSYDVPGGRRFVLKHDQLLALQVRCRPRSR